MSDTPTTVVLDGPKFNTILQEAIVAAAERTAKDLEEAMQVAHDMAIGLGSLSSDEKEHLSQIEKLRMAQNRQVIGLTLINFGEEYGEAFARLLDAAKGDQPTAISSPTQPKGEKPEPSWKKLHELIGFKSE